MTEIIRHFFVRFNLEKFSIFFFFFVRSKKEEMLS